MQEILTIEQLSLKEKRGSLGKCHENELLCQQCVTVAAVDSHVTVVAVSRLRR